MGGCSSAGQRNRAQNPKDAALDSLLNEVEYMESSSIEQQSSATETSQQQDISAMIRKHSQLLTYIEKKMHKVYGEIHLISMLLPNSTPAEALILAVQEKRFTSRLEYEYELGRLNELKDCSNGHSNLLGILALFSSDSRRSSAVNDNSSSFDLCSGKNRNKLDSYDNPTNHMRITTSNSNNTTATTSTHRILLVTEYLSRDLATETFIRSLNISNSDIQPPLDHGYTESELLFIIKSLVSPLAYLQLQEKHHGSLKSDLVFITNDGTIQLALPKIIPTLPAYALLISGNLSQSQGGYLSPLLAAGITNNLQLPQHNVYKSDVFSLGVMILETAYLKRMDRLYKFNTPSVKLDRSYDSNVDSVVAGTEVDRNALQWLIEGLGRKYSQEVVSICKAMVSLSEDNRPDFLELAQMLGLDQEEDQDDMQGGSREYDSTDERIELLPRVYSSPSKDGNVQRQQQQHPINNHNPFRSLTPLSTNLRTNSPYRYIQNSNGKSSTSSEILVTNNLAVDNYYDNSNASSGKDQNLRISTNSSRLGSATKVGNNNDRYYHQQEEQHNQLLDSSHLPSFNYSAIDKLPSASPIRPSDIQHIKATSFVLHPCQNNTNNSNFKKVSSNNDKTHNNSMLSNGDAAVTHNESEFLDKDRSEGWMGYKTPQYSLAGVSQQNQLTSPNKPPLPQQNSNHKNNGSQNSVKNQMMDRMGYIHSSPCYTKGNHLLPENHRHGSSIPRKNNTQNSSSSDVRCLTSPDQDPNRGHSARTPSPISSKSLRNLRSMQQMQNQNNIINKTNNINSNTNSKVSKIIGLIAGGANSTSKSTINTNNNLANRKITTPNFRKQPGTTTATTITVEITSKMPSKTSRLGTEQGVRTTKNISKPLEEKQQSSYKPLEKEKQYPKQQYLSPQLPSTQAVNAVVPSSKAAPWSSRFQLPFTPSPTNKHTAQASIQETSNINTNLLNLPAKLKSNEINKLTNPSSLPLDINSFVTPARSTNQFNKSEGQPQQHDYHHLHLDQLNSGKKYSSSTSSYQLNPPQHVRSASSLVTINQKINSLEDKKIEHQSNTNKSGDLLTVEDTLNYIRNHSSSGNSNSKILNNRFPQSQNTQVAKHIPRSRYDNDADKSTSNHTDIIQQPLFSINSKEEVNNHEKFNDYQKKYSPQGKSSYDNNNIPIRSSNYNNNSISNSKDNYIDPVISKLLSHHSRALSSEPLQYTRASTEPSAMDYSAENLQKNRINSPSNPIINSSSDWLGKRMLETKENKEEKSRESVTDNNNTIKPQTTTAPLLLHPPTYDEQQVQKIISEITSPNRFSNDKSQANKEISSRITASLLRTSSSNLNSSYINQQKLTPLSLADTLELQRLKESASKNNTITTINDKGQQLDQLHDSILNSNALTNTVKDIHSSKAIAETQVIPSQTMISQNNLLANKQSSSSSQLSSGLLAPLSSFVPAVFTNEFTYPSNIASQLARIKQPTTIAKSDFSTSSLLVPRNGNDTSYNITSLDIKPKDTISSKVVSFAPLQQPLVQPEISAPLDFTSQANTKLTILSPKYQPSSEIKNSDINSILPSSSLISPGGILTSVPKQAWNESKKEQWTPSLGFVNFTNITTNIAESNNGNNSISSQYPPPVQSAITTSNIDPFKSNSILESKLPYFPQHDQEKSNKTAPNQLDSIIPSSIYLAGNTQSISTTPEYIPYYNNQLNSITTKVETPSFSSSLANDNKLKLDSNINARSLLLPSVGLNSYNYLEHLQQESSLSNENIIPKITFLDGQKQSQLPFEPSLQNNDSQYQLPNNTQIPATNSSDNTLAMVVINPISDDNNNNNSTQKNKEKSNNNGTKPNINLSPLIEGLNEHSDSDTPEILVNSNAYLSPVSLSKRLENQQIQEQQQQFLVNSTHLGEEQQNFFESISSKSKEIAAPGLDNNTLRQKQSIVEDHVTRQELSNKAENFQKYPENSQENPNYNLISAFGTEFAAQINLFERYNGDALQADGTNPRNTPSSASKPNPNQEISSFSLTSLHSSDDPLKIERYEDGSYYEGEKLDGMRHGKGKFCYGDGGSYEGDWQSGHMSGYGLLYYPSGQKAYEGNWVNDKFSGLGIIFNENPQYLSGQFDCKDMSNLGDYWVRYEGEFSDDFKQGKGTIYLTNGERFEGHFEDDLIHGRGSFFRKDQTQVEGEWTHNVYKEGSGDVKDNNKYE